MPTYEYSCLECDLTKEVSRPIAEHDSVEICEKCGQTGCLKKVPSLLTSYNKQKSERELAGERVEREIEEKRKLLLDHKKEYTNKEYKP